jgi:hypothetical protein
MNRLALKQAQSCIDELIAAVRYQQSLEKPAALFTLDVWLSALGTTQAELKEFEASLSPTFVLDMQGMAYGINGE